VHAIDEAEYARLKWTVATMTDKQHLLSVCVDITLKA
jgi:hypothetical protein